MANNNKKGTKSAAQEAAAQSAPETKNTKQETAGKSPVNVIQLGDLQKYAELSKTGNMDHNHIMDMIRVQHETFRMDPKAAEHTGMSQESIDAINRINAIEQVALMASVATLDTTPFAIAMRAAQLPAITEAAAALGIVIDQKALPAPDAQGNVQLPSDAIKLSEEQKKTVKTEAQATAEPAEMDPTKIDSEEKLKKTLLTILVKGNGSENIYDKLSTAINFYEAYLGIQAGKAENPDEARAELKKRTQVDFLSDIAHLLGKCTFTLSGIAKFMYEQTERTKSPVVAFCTLRDASLNKTTGMPRIDDQLVADIVKVLIRWYADTEIAVSKEVIAGFERDIEILRKDEAKNKKGIEDGLSRIENAKKHIENVENVVTYVNVPDRAVVDNFITSYSDNKSEGFKLARMMGSKIIHTYYGEVDLKTVKMDGMLHNLQQYAGIITNMFLPPLNKIADYSESKIAALEFTEPAKGEAKNE